MQNDDFIDRFDLEQILLELEIVGFKHLKHDIVKIVLAELKHFMPGSVGLGEHSLYLALFGRLMDAPGFFKRGLNVFLEKKMSENELVFIYSLF